MISAFFVLDNGLCVVYVPRRGTGTVALSIRGDIGSIHEKENEMGAAHFLEHLVLEGTKKFPSQEKLSHFIAEVGGRRGATTDKTTTEYRVNVLKQDVERGFEFLSQILTQPLLLQESIERNKKIIVQEIEEVMMHPKRKLAAGLSKLFYPKHRLGTIVPGTPRDIEKLTTTTLKTFFARHYTPDRFVLSVCGDLDKNRLKELAHNYFADWHAKDTMITTSNKEISHAPDIPHNDRGITIEKSGEAGQVAFAIGYPNYRATNPNKHAALLLAKILGQGETSRLFQKVRMRHAYVYALTAHSDVSKYQGMFVITGNVTRKHINDVLQCIAEEIQTIVATPVSKDELRGAQKRVEAMDLFNMESSRNTASYYSKLYIEQPNNNGYMEELAAMKSVSATELQSVAKDIFTHKPQLAIVSPTLRARDIDTNVLQALSISDT